MHSETRAIYTLVKDLIFLFLICRELQIPLTLPAIIMEDNSAVITVTTVETAYTKKCKHFLMLINYIKEQVNLGLIRILKIDGTINRADLHTKILRDASFTTKTHQILGLPPPTPPVPRKQPAPTHTILHTSLPVLSHALEAPGPLARPTHPDTQCVIQGFDAPACSALTLRPFGLPNLIRSATQAHAPGMPGPPARHKARSPGLKFSSIRPTLPAKTSRHDADTLPHYFPTYPSTRGTVQDPSPGSQFPFIRRLRPSVTRSHCQPPSTRYPRTVPNLATSDNLSRLSTYILQVWKGMSTEHLRVYQYSINILTNIYNVYN